MSYSPVERVYASPELSMNEHASLYEYWRRLLMEEQQNEERNHMLMRKLDEIEQRTSLLSERSERLRQLRDNFSELIRERYLSPEEMSYRYDYNQPSKTSDYSPPEYIPDPILFGLSTPPWIPREGPLLLSRNQTPERWRPPPSPPAAPGPPAHRQPRAPSPHPASKEPASSADRRPRYPDGETSEPWFNHFAKNSGGSLLEPSVYWMPDSAEFFRTTSALDRKPARSMATEEEDNMPHAATDAALSMKQQEHQEQHQQQQQQQQHHHQQQQQQQYHHQQQMPSRMSQFSDYIPSNESPPVARRRLGPSTQPRDLGGVFINHTTEVLLSDAGATGKTRQQQDHCVADTKKAADSDTSGDSFHQGDTDEARHDPKSIPSVRLRKASRSHGGQAAASRSREGHDTGTPLKKQGSFKQSRREAAREATPASRGAQPHAAPRNVAPTRRPSNGSRAETSKSTPSNSRTSKDVHEPERSTRRARQHARTGDHESHTDRNDVKQAARDASERSEATDAGRDKNSDWSVSCGEQLQLSDSKQDASRDTGQREDEVTRVQDSKLQLPMEKDHSSWNQQSGTDRLMRSGSEGQLLELDSSGHRNERRSVPAALVESRHLAGHSQRMTLPNTEEQEADHHHSAQTVQNSGEAPGKCPDKQKSKSHKQSRNLSNSSSSSSKSLPSDSPKEAPSGKGKGQSNDNSEDSFFDKDILPQDTTAYQFLLGNVKPTAPEKPSVMDQPSESSTDIENEMAAAVMTSQPKYKKSPEELEDPKAGSNDSSPPEYDVTSVNIQNLISAKVKHDVPSLISRKVLGLDMYAEPKILQSQKRDDEDSFFD
ncbi:nucleolar and coiled-body phosphoprotein 1-like isoform X1 [Dermacentor albipictus]|uniref:nucleolar and coiled-body phosphoprotein 1-like isoform X1 n=2 Tax=Dermacentor albipictus TaxID=60249 RepID=UPI0038FCC0A3